MKRKEYRQRQAVLMNVEKDIWSDFVDLCDREHKSTNLKFSELLEQELQKNVIGECNPIRVPYGDEPNKLFQTDLTQWMQTVHLHRNDNVMLTKMANLGQAITATANDYIRKNRRPYRK